MRTSTKFALVTGVMAAISLQVIGPITAAVWVVTGLGFGTALRRKEDRNDLDSPWFYESLSPQTKQYMQDVLRGMRGKGGRI